MALGAIAVVGDEQAPVEPGHPLPGTAACQRRRGGPRQRVGGCLAHASNLGILGGLDRDRLAISRRRPPPFTRFKGLMRQILVDTIPGLSRNVSNA